MCILLTNTLKCISVAYVYSTVLNAKLLRNVTVFFIVIILTFCEDARGTRPQFHLPSHFKKPLTDKLS